MDLGANVDAFGEAASMGFNMNFAANIDYANAGTYSAMSMAVQGVRGACGPEGAQGPMGERGDKGIAWRDELKGIEGNEQL